MDTASSGPDEPQGSADGGHEQAPEQAIVLHETYRLIRQVGFGGTGVVYEAMHTRLPRRFAIKVLLRSLLAHPEAHARFCHEAELMSQLRHPHVVQIFDFNVTHENQPYFVMEYLEGRDLETELAGGAAMPLARVVPIVEAVASALMAAHRHGIVHRDLKPSNVFLCDVDDAREGDHGASASVIRAEHPFVKVLDFGISPAGAMARLSLGASIVGTPHYMAPEQAAGRGKSVDARADQFALAAITYAMLTGRDPFSGEDLVSVLYQIVHEDPPPLDRHVQGPWDTRRVQQVLSRAMAKDPALRFPTILDFSDALREAADHAHAPATPPPVVASAPPACGTARRAGAAASPGANARSRRASRASRGSPTVRSFSHWWRPRRSGSSPSRAGCPRCRPAWSRRRGRGRRACSECGRRHSRPRRRRGRFRLRRPRRRRRPRRQLGCGCSSGDRHG